MRTCDGRDDGGTDGSGVEHAGTAEQRTRGPAGSHGADGESVSASESEELHRRDTQCRRGEQLRKGPRPGPVGTSTAAQSTADEPHESPMDR